MSTLKELAEQIESLKRELYDRRCPQQLTAARGAYIQCELEKDTHEWHESHSTETFRDSKLTTIKWITVTQPESETK